ncbi:class I SAM-dependent methyltransferase [Methanosphaera sp. Vir-13MRS]|uniref:class I SAM-dependent methyltransferase n=1 Tax=Candidatus Methanosphaera massiliense TaxID=3017187 RepID=UPI002380BFF2|nr:class I SAM-dependent methyltransferase [Candidatus Methanosphaera massiliense]MDE4078866.1 class I SAM-dependent methyltransferase [Candidatus Methanosphaera massiliense]
MSDLREHFNQAADEYDNLITKTLVNYDEMTDALINAIPDQKSPRVLDLGCGTGNITEKVLKRFPDAKITCLDVSDKMIDIAKEKLSDYDNIEYVNGDFTIVDIIDKYDAIISSLALHHIPSDEEKKEMYQHIYDALNVGGVFYNADVIKPNSEYNQILNEKMNDKYMEEHGVSNEQKTSHKQDRENNDVPSTLVTHIKLLEEVGFEQIDVIWKYYANAVYGGTRL